MAPSSVSLSVALGNGLAKKKTREIGRRCRIMQERPFFFVLVKRGVTISFGEEFETQHDYPPKYLSYTDIEGHRISLLYGGNLVDLEVSSYTEGRDDV